MRDLLDRIDSIAEATLDASTIIKYPERFEIDPKNDNNGLVIIWGHFGILILKSS
jgi:hypothetical protein